MSLTTNYAIMHRIPFNINSYLLIPLSHSNSATFGSFLITNRLSFLSSYPLTAIPKLNYKNVKSQTAYKLKKREKPAFLISIYYSNSLISFSICKILFYQSKGWMFVKNLFKYLNCFLCFALFHPYQTK